jgi:hypothetical protein
VEVSISTSTNNLNAEIWRPVCGDGWGVREAMVNTVLSILRILEIF